MLNTGLIDTATGNCKLIFNIITSVIDTGSEADPQLRRTLIHDSDGKVVGEIGWTGQRPQDIVIADEKIDGLTDLFGSSTVRFMPKILSIPTRFDTEYIWTATPDSLTLFDYDSNQTKGNFRQNCIRLAGHFLHTHIPGIGSNYLEFELHPLAHPVEIIVSFLMMEILRRGRFSLTLYSFERPKLWQLCDARDSVCRRLRRNML